MVLLFVCCVCLCVCVWEKAANQHISRNKYKPADSILDIDLHFLLCFLVASPYHSSNSTQAMYILRTQPYLTSTWGTSSSEYVWMLSQWWPGCDQRRSGHRHKPPIKLGSQNAPLNVCCLYTWLPDLARFFRVIYSDIRVKSLYIPLLAGTRACCFFVVMRGFRLDTLFAEMTSVSFPNQQCVFYWPLSFLLFIAAGCHLCHPAHVPVHLDNKKDQ